MTGPGQRNARAELDSARTAVARLDAGRGAEDLAADLIETWNAVEATLRALVGSTVLSGQPLIREARQRQMISFDLANSLAEFQAANDRVHNTSYRPTDADLNAARTAFLKLDTALMSGDAGTTTFASAPRMSGSEPRMSGSEPRTSGSSPRKSGSATTVQSDVKTMPIAPDSAPVKVVGPPARFPVWMAALALVVVIAVVVGVFMLRGGGPSALDQGITAYRAGRREEAVSAFSRAAREDKNAVLPHVYLARMAREVGNFTLASQELELALQADPTNASALREMGANLLAQGNYELARRFYVRAVQADPTDKNSLGYLGCSLMRLNRASEATNFLNRAGPGPWANCTPATTSNQAGQVINPASIPK